MPTLLTINSATLKRGEVITMNYALHLLRENSCEINRSCCRSTRLPIHGARGNARTHKRTAHGHSRGCSLTDRLGIAFSLRIGDNAPATDRAMKTPGLETAKR